MADLLAPEHTGALVAIAAAAVVAAAAPRAWPGRWVTYLCRGLALVLLVGEVSWWVFVATGGVPGSTLATSLPLQLCDAGVLVASLALWFRWQLLVELTYFWGLAGCMQALLTPDLAQHFPTYQYLQYYIAHGGVVVAGLLFVIGLRLRPRRYAVIEVAGITILYAAFAGAVDALTGANYLYLRSKPPTPTLLDLMGPWPWYIAGAALIGACLLAILEAPFHIGGRQHAAEASA